LSMEMPKGEAAHRAAEPKTKGHPFGCPFVLAAGEGFEPSQTESESIVLPLHNPAKFYPPPRGTNAIIPDRGKLSRGNFYFFLSPSAPRRPGPLPGGAQARSGG